MKAPIYQGMAAKQKPMINLSKRNNLIQLVPLITKSINWEVTPGITV